MDNFLYYMVCIGDQLSQITKIEVNVGDDIDSIKKRLKVNETPDLDSVPASRIVLLEGIDSAEPLSSLMIWNSNVTWGKPETPLVVRTMPRAIAPRSYDVGT